VALPRGGPDKKKDKAKAEANEPPKGDALDEILNELEHKIERVRTLYDQYFMGIEKMEPQVARKEVTRFLLTYAQMHIRNTGQRFRFHSLQQKWNIYVTLWNRTMREIEAGTYRRDVARVTRKLAREGKSLPAAAAIELGLKRAGAAPGAQKTTTEAPATATAAAPAKPEPAPARPVPAVPSTARPGAAPPPIPAGARAPAPTPPARPTAPAPAPTAAAAAPRPAGVTDDEMRALYKRYVQAKRMIADPGADNIKYEALMATVAKQTPAIMEKYNCSAVEFTVVVKDSKVVLKAIPKK
jgi:hypothetical protein